MPFGEQCGGRHVVQGQHNRCRYRPKETLAVLQRKSPPVGSLPKGSRAQGRNTGRADDWEDAMWCRVGAAACSRWPEQAEEKDSGKRCLAQNAR